MKKVKLLLEPAEVEMISDALNSCYDDDCLEDDDDILENLCQMFNILRKNGNFVKVTEDMDTHYVDECECGCCDPDTRPDDDDLVTDEDDEECDLDDDNHVGCGVTKQDLKDAWQDLKDAWNAQEPWNTGK